MKKICVKIIGIILALIILLHTGVTVFAASSEAQQLENQKSENNKKINEASSELQEVQAQKSETVKQVEQLSSQISDYEAQIATLDNQITDMNNKIKESEDQIKKAEDDYQKQEELLEERLVASYMAGETSYLDFLLSSESITDLISNYFLISEVATTDAEILESIQKKKEEIEKAKATLEESKKQLDTSKAQKQSVSIQLQQSRSEKNSQVQKLSEDEKKIESQIEELRVANQQLNKDIEAANKRYAAQLEALRKQQQSSSGGGTSGTSSSGFIFPVPSAYAYITTGLYYSSGQYHGAVDFGSGGINGQPVYAVADGVVHVVKNLTTSYGSHIIIAHTNGLYTLYAHGQPGSICVSEGQQVRQGQQIMRVGTSGNSTGPHLHFEVRTSPGTYSNRVSPTNYLPKKS